MPRRAFTLVELLIVIAIIGLLMGLLFPAINTARESGRATSCRNNLRNLGQALIQHAEAKHRYPGVWTYNRNRFNLWYWRPLLYEVFPELGRNDLYERYRRDAYLKNGMPPFFIEMMICPSDPQTGAAPSSYAYNFGYGDRTTYNQANGVFNWDNGTFARFQNVTGKSVPPAYIAQVDGTEHTLLCGENVDAGDWTDVSWFQVGLCWLDAAPAYQTDLRINARRGLSQNQRNDGDDWTFLRPSSNHRGQVNAVFAGGSVRSLREEMDYVVYAQLLTSRGIEATNGQTGGAPLNVPVRNYALSDGDF